MIALGLIVGAAAGYIVYKDALDRGKDKQTAALWGFGTLASSLGTYLLLLGFLALYYFVGRKITDNRRPDKQVIDIEGVPLEELIPCPMCGRKVKDDCSICPHCHHTLRPKCVNCAQELRREWKVCPYCGADANPK
ncbi:MAG TPA: zinc ribbon domain-containing protein [Selenomonadales bacterium]|nr:zinc ribbon domain-containing protein [Selenomonadales bacterium]